MHDFSNFTVKITWTGQGSGCINMQYQTAKTIEMRTKFNTDCFSG